MCNLVFGRLRARVSNSPAPRLHNHRTPLALPEDLKTILICQQSQSSKAALNIKSPLWVRNFCRFLNWSALAGSFPQSWEGWPCTHSVLRYSLLECALAATAFQFHFCPKINPQLVLLTGRTSSQSRMGLDHRVD